MTQAALTLENAPRDPVELAKAGRFRLRTLATSLGLGEDPEKWKSFMTCSNEEQATVIVDYLKSRDASNGTSSGDSKPANGRRSPSNTATAGAAPANTTRTPSNAAAASKKGRPAASTDGSTSEAVEKLLERLTAVEEKLDMTLKKLEGVATSEESEFNKELQLMGMSLSLKLAEQVLGAGATEVLEAASEDIPLFKGRLLELLGYDNSEEEASDNTEGN